MNAPLSHSSSLTGVCIWIAQSGLLPRGAETLMILTNPLFMLGGSLDPWQRILPDYRA